MSTTTKRTAAWGAACSVALLTPCFWQQRIQAGDLSSHVYNAWLAQLIERGQAPGLTLARQWNNVLFDLMLGTMMRAWGPAAAQRIAVSLAVLVFFWGAFALVWSLSRSRNAPWQLVPCLAMLAYGWVFHMGLFNFYISMGLAFAALALARRGQLWAYAAAVFLMAIGCVAHPLPMVWAVGVFVYGRVAQALAPRQRVMLMAGTLFALALTGFLLGQFFTTRRGPDQFMAMTGAEQVWLYGKAYIAVAAALLLAWLFCLGWLVSVRGIQRTLLDTRFQLCLLGVAALILLPAGVLLPGYRSGLDFLAERMSLAGAVLFCGWVASVKLPKPLVGAMAALALVFFALSYADDRSLNKVETRMERAVTQLPARQRVVSTLANPESRINALAHMVDRICIGRCFSYANYEPTTAQFRVRAYRENPFVVSDYGDSWNIQTGVYVVKPKDVPLYNIDICEPAGLRICAAPLQAGTTLHHTGLPAGSSLVGGG